MILLLGATGLLGHNVLRLLLERGEPVRVLIRPESKLLSLETWSPPEMSADGQELRRPEIVYGDPMDFTTLYKAAQDCVGIVNCIGTTDMSLPGVNDFLPVNCNFPAMLCHLMESTGINFLVHTSTANTILPGTKEFPTDESYPFGAPFDTSPYAISKKAGEDQLLSYARSHPGRSIVIVNPGFMIGPFDAKPSSATLLLAGWRRRLMFVPDGGKSFVHVRDVAKAVVRVLEAGGSGRYLLTGESLTFREFYALQAGACGYRQRIVTLPDFLVRLAGRLGDLLQAFGVRTMLCTHNVRQLLVEEWYDCSRARRELNFPHTPVADAIRDYFSWREASR